jgi:hypothetical protein
MRFNPKALMRMRASVGEGEGLGTEALRKREEAGPEPFFISRGVNGVEWEGTRCGDTYCTHCSHDGCWFIILEDYGRV